MHMAGTANGAAWMHQMLVDLRSAGHRVSAVIGGADGTLAARLRRDDIPFLVLNLDLFTRSSLWSAGQMFLALVRLLRRERPDVVHVHLYPTIFIGRLAAWVADVPARFSMIPGPYYLEAPTLREIDLETAPFDSKVIASCEYTRTLYDRGGVPREHVELIYYGQDDALFNPATADGARVRRELGIAAGRPVVGDVAYFYPPAVDGPFVPPHLIGRGIKGHEVLLRAAQQVRRHVPDVLFLLVGDGWGADGIAYMARLQELARELDVSDVVRFAGPRTDIPDTLMAFDVSVQCSLNENLGGSIESLLMERPLVASDVGGLPDAVRHEETGLLVPPGDADALAAAITRLLQDRVLARRLAAQGRAFALERLTLSRAVRALDALYRRELDGVAARDASARRGYRLLRSAWRAMSVAPWVRTHVVARMSRAARRVPAPHLQIIQMAACRDNAEWFAQIASRLRRQGRSVSAVITLPAGSLGTRLRGLGVPFAATPLSYADEAGPARLPRFAARAVMNTLRLAREFRRQRIDIVHTHVFSSMLVGRVAAWLARVPCRVSMVPGPLHLEAPITRQLDRLTAWMDHRVIAASRATYDHYRAMGYSAPRLQCIPYGVDAARFNPATAGPTQLRTELGLEPDAPLVGLIAHFYPPRTDWQTPPHMRGRGLKGHEDFLDAARLVLLRHPEVRFLLVGTGISEAGERYRQELIANVQRSELASAVHVTGRRDDIEAVLGTLQVAVQCSLTENYGGTIESLLMARPTVATNVGGMPETVRHGVTGLLVPPSAPQALADAIVWSLEHREEAERMARAGRALMLSAFTIEHTVRAIEQQYSSVLGIRPPVAEATVARGEA